MSLDFSNKFCNFLLGTPKIGFKNRLLFVTAFIFLFQSTHTLFQTLNFMQLLLNDLFSFRELFALELSRKREFFNLNFQGITFVLMLGDFSSELFVQVGEFINSGELFFFGAFKSLYNLLLSLSFIISIIQLHFKSFNLILMFAIIIFHLSMCVRKLTMCIGKLISKILDR